MPDVKANSVEVVIDQKARRASEKMLRSQQKPEIYNNYATPLIGAYLNLTSEPVSIECPSCNSIGLSQVRDDLKWWALEVNRCLGCLFLACCCCFCMDYRLPCRKYDHNHYCANCGCYFGRAMRISPLRTGLSPSNN